jgi:hypothetical protein
MHSLLRSFAPRSSLRIPHRTRRSRAVTNHDHPCQVRTHARTHERTERGISTRISSWRFNLRIHALHALHATTLPPGASPAARSSVTSTSEVTTTRRSSSVPLRSQTPTHLESPLPVPQVGGLPRPPPSRVLRRRRHGRPGPHTVLL